MAETILNAVLMIISFILGAAIYRFGVKSGNPQENSYYSKSSKRKKQRNEEEEENPSDKESWDTEL